MDHLPSITFPVGSPPVIPYLSYGFPTFDHGTFADYPSRCGFGGRSDGIHATMRFVQEWMFFGAMEAIWKHAKIKFNRKDFIPKHADGRMVITTQHLYRYMWQYMANGGAGSGYSVVTLEPAKLLFGHLQHAIWDHGKISPELEREYKLVMLSISILGEALEGQEKWGLPTWLVPGMGHSLTMGWQCSGILADLLLEAGWCAPEIKSLRRESSSPGYLYFLGMLNRRTTGKAHTGCAELELCGANQIDEETYATLHVEKDCACSFVSLSGPETMRKMCRILDAGRIPAIEFSRQTSKVQVITVSEGDTDDVRPYVAISHVWADGLGNAADNALPACQLKRIQVLVDALYPAEKHPIPFWMDTLCVPFDMVHRKLAIRMMSKTYRDADKVLVLDAWIQEGRISGSVEECMMRIKYSAWMTRLWTYQESELSKTKYFQFSDGAITTRELNARYASNLLGYAYSGPVGLLHTDRVSTKFKSDVDSITRNRDDLAFPVSAVLASALHLKRIRNNEHGAAAPVRGISCATMVLRSIKRLKPKLRCVLPLRGSAQSSDFLSKLSGFLPIAPVTVQGIAESHAWKRSSGKPIAEAYREFSDYGTPADIEMIEATAAIPLSNPVLSAGTEMLTSIDETSAKMNEDPDSVTEVSTLFRFANCCSDRQTSKPDDAVLCLGGILGLDLRLLLEYTAAERTREFLILLKEIPMELMFSPGPRIQEDGFRWAAKAFSLAEPKLTNHAWTSAFKRSSGILGPAGLIANLEYEWIADPTVLPKIGSLQIRDDDFIVKELFWLSPRGSTDWSSFRKHKKMALLFRDWQDSKAALVSVSMLADVENPGPDGTRVRFEALVEVEKVQEAGELGIELPFVVSHIQRARESRKWCIS